MSKPFRPAHWSRVTATISARFGLDWQASKRAYDALRTRNESTPTLKLVSSLERLPVWARRAAEPERFEKKAIERARRMLPLVEKEYKAALERAGKKPTSRYQPILVVATTGRRPRRLADSTGPVAPGSLLHHPPQLIPPEPLAPNPNHKPRNRFERLLEDNGLPVAIGRTTVGKELASRWRDEKTIGRIAKDLGIGYRQISRDGGMSEKVKARVWKNLESLYPDMSAVEIRGKYQGILKACYAKGKGK